jgi:cytochrome P450
VQLVTGHGGLGGADGAQAAGRIDLTDLDNFAEGFPHAAFTELRAHDPVWWHPPTEHTPDGEGFWVVSRHADVVAVAADSTTFSSEGGGGRVGGGTLIEDLPAGFAAGVLFNMMDEPRHNEIRKLCTPSVTPRALGAVEDDLVRRAKAVVGAAVARGEGDFLVDVAAELPLQAASELLGVPQEDRHLLIEWADATLDYDDRELGETGDRSAAAAAAMFEYGTQLLAAKQRCPDRGLISTIANADQLTELEQQMFFNLLIAAASETTRNSIAGGLVALIDAPEQWARLRADRTLLPGAVEEILRWTSSTTYNRRTATVDAVVAGQSMAAGQKVTLWWSSANRDDAVFDDPFRFDVDRRPNRHVAFGHGGHFCLGAALARIEIRVVLDALLDRVERVERRGPIEWTRSNKHTGIRHLPVRYVPGDRRPS